MADRGWMYSGWKRGRPTNEWVEKTNEFLDRAYSIPELVESDTIKCPCAMCRNYFRHKRPKIELHLCHNGYKENYQTWTSHGERRENHEHALLGGPVQYRWMYPFERSNVHSVRNKTPRYDDAGSTSVRDCGIELFEHIGRCFISLGFRDLTIEQSKAAALYILTNIPEMDDFFKEFDNEQWKGRSQPSARDISNLRLNGWKGTRGRNRGPNFFDWFKNICAIRSSVHNVLRQISYGFRKRVSSYGCYDVNGYRFRSEKYESKRAGLATTNSGVCVTCTDDNGNALEYFGVIEDIIKISWEGREQLDLVLFYCRWFDPTSRGVKRTENLGLVEVKHSSRLQNFEPFVLASQVTQVYYLSYASDDPSLKDWWVVYHVAPRDRLPPIDINNNSIETEGPTNDISFFQEDGLEGTFVIDLGDIELIDTLASDEITDPKELEQLEKQTVAPEQEEILESDEEGDEDDAESYDEDCYEEEDF
ncbi:uncharacterized protein [Miscanthus floridulus]|uniref:uncharacterized protein n=1 Tax=Miscanthus floridulus TaxID=154761 RepID=UPI00345798FA